MYVIHFLGIPLPRRLAYRSHTAVGGIATLNLFFRRRCFTVRYVHGGGR